MGNNIFQRIAQVMKDVEYLAKDDKVETGGGKSYRAISEEKVTSTVRVSLIENGIVIIPVKQEHSRTDERIVDSYGKEKVNRITTVDVVYRIQSADDPADYIEVMSSGTGVDTQDKGVGKAMTYAYKYMLLRTFAIPTGDDADKVSSDLYDSQLYEGKPDKVSAASALQLAALTKELARAGWSAKKGLANINAKFMVKLDSQEQITEPQALWLLKFLEGKPNAV